MAVSGLMSFMRFSAAPAGRLSDRTIPWAIFGERPDVPDGLEDSALAGASLAQIAATPGAPMFEPESLFGAHMAALDFDLENDGPVVVFVHGFQHEPRRPILPRARSDNPHRCLYHFTETPGGPGSREERIRHITPWFARAMLEKGRGAPEECKGVAVGYSYASWGGSADEFLPGLTTRLLTKLGYKRPTVQPAAPYSNAYRDAEVAGYGLAAVLTQLRARLDHAGYVDKKIDIVSHSLGARATLSALALIAQRWPEDHTITRIDRVLMMGGACYWGQAAYALANLIFSEAKSLPQFFNFTSRSDDVLRYLASRATEQAAHDDAMEDLSMEEENEYLLTGGLTIGMHGKPPFELYPLVGAEYGQWVDIPLDSARVVRRARRQGFKVMGKRRFSLGDHWLHYTHPGNWDLYRAILHDRQKWTTDSLADAIGA
ncbi:MAG: hypothetical protein AAGB15_07440 [Pseudomonadota bacterium]